MAKFGPYDVFMEYIIMEDSLFIQHGNILRVRVLEKTAERIKLEVVKSLKGNVKEGTLLDVEAQSEEDSLTFIDKKDSDRYVLI